jgi:purine-nucleoside phosphorylase
MNQAASFSQWAEIAAQARPRIAIVLGSGMGAVGKRLQNPLSISFDQIPEYGTATVDGHKGCVTVGNWVGIPILIFEGRLHFYEGHSWRKVVVPIMTAKALGISQLILTNASGGIHEALRPGSLMAIQDHIEWSKPYFWRCNGQGDQMSKKTSPYSSRMHGLLREAATLLDVELHFGNYGAVLGPCYETPAEIRALQSLGADAVGMSTAREAQAAFEAGLECLAISCITNRAAGLSANPIIHEEVLTTACRRSDALASLLEKCLPNL